MTRFLAGLALASAFIGGLPAGAATYLDETNPRLPALPYDANSLAAGDVNGDTHPDIVIGINGQVRILINDGAGNFADETAARLPALSGAFMGAALVDLTGDGRPELFLANAAGRNRLLINDGTGVFTDQSAARLPIDTDQSMSVAVGDIDGDGDIDIVVGNRTTRNRVLINNGAAVFTDQSAARLPADTDQSFGVALVDVDGNGGLDLVVANMEGQDRIYINNNLGFFTDQTAARLPAAVNDSLHVTAADVNKDGKPDLVIAGGADGARVLLNDGTGVFAPIALPGQPEYAVRVAVGDVDFDGAPDIVVANAGQTRFLRGDGASPPTFVDMTATVVPSDNRRSFGIALFDFDHDLDLDLVLVAQANEARALKNFIAEPRVLIAISPGYIEVGDTVTIDVTAFDEDGVAVTNVTVEDPDGVQTAVPLSGGTQGTGNYLVPADNAKAGTYLVTVASQDTLGAIANRTETFIAQTADLTAPVVSINIVEPAPLLFGKAVEITVTATDDRAVAGVTMLVNGVPVPLDSSGHATYVTSAVGLHTVDASATDLAGNVGNATQKVFTVLDDVTAPVVTVSATPDPVDITNPVTIQASATDDVSVVSLTAKVEGPGTPVGGTPVPLDGSGMGSYIPYVPGTYTVTAEATDPKGNVGSNTDTFLAQGVPDVQDPVVTLQVTPINVEPGTPVSIHAEATDNIFVSSLTVDVNGIPVALDGSGNATFTPLVVGDYTVTATATDPTGNDGTMVVVFHAVDPTGDNTAPTALITTPLNHAEVGRTATIVGTANDNVALAQYTLAYAPMGTNNFTQFAQGFAPVVNGTLGTLDTSSLRNGIYDIRLTTLDLNNNVAQAQRTVAVSGTFKPGVLHLEFPDLEMTLAGTPLRIDRIYDSRDRGTVGDFGHGWTISIFQRGKYSNNMPLGEEWQINSGGLFGVANCGSSNETALHVTEIRISDTEFYQFAAMINMTPHLASICEGFFVFQQVGGVPGATLVPIGGNAIYAPSGSGTWYNDVDLLEVFDPSNVRLTTIDGRIMDLNLNQGLTRIADRNGNALTITPGGVSHTSGTAVVFTRDGMGRITRITDPAGNFIQYAYDASGDLVSVTDRAGKVTTFTYLAGHYLETITVDGETIVANEYDASGLLSAQEDADGNRTEFAHDTATGIETITRSDGTIKILRYGPNGKLSEAEKDGVKKTFTYDAAGNVLTETNGEGIVRTFTYNAQNRLTSETDGAGNLRSYGYDAQGRISTLTANGETVTFTYDANGNPTGMSDGDGQPVQTITPNAQGNPTQVVTGGGTYNQTYTAGGLVQTVAGPNGALTTYVYNANNQVMSVTVKRTDNGVPANETTTLQRDSNGRITRVTDPLGHFEQYTYDGKGNLASRTDKNGNVTTYEYDSRGNRTRVNHPDGTFELTGYDLDYRVTSVSNRLTDIGDLLGNVTFYEYGSFNDITKITHQNGAIANYVSDLAGRRVSATDPSGVLTTYEYDGAGRVTKETNAFGQRTFTYLGTGLKPASMTDPLGKTTQYTYDNALFSSQRLLVTTYPDTTTRGQTWGPNHRIATRTDELGRTTSYTYDAAGNLATVTDPLLGVTSYTYDEVGNRLTETDANGHTTSYRYDALGRLVRRTLPLGQFETFTYDPNGNKLTHTNFNGQTTSYTYDSMNRVATRTLPAGGGITTYTYNKNGKIATATDSLGVTTYSYDTRNRLTGVTMPGGFSITYAYDAADRRTQVVSPAGTVDYTYDAAGRLKTVEDPNGDVTTYSYDAANRITQVDHANGTRTTYAYDLRDRPTLITHLATDHTTVLAQHGYTHDLAGRRTQMTEPGRTVVYTYDALGRLTSEDDNGLLTTYTYDAVGNRLTRTVGANPVETYTYDNNNRLLTAGPLSFTYDANGNTTSMTGGGATFTFEYDALDRITRVTGPALIDTEFVYDHSGNRVQRDDDGIVTKFVVDPNDPSGLSQVVAELDAAGTAQAGLVYGLQLLSRLTGGGDSYYHGDAIGSTRALTNGAGALSDEYDYAAFGQTVFQSGATPNPNLFAGQRFEPRGSLYHLRARDYMPETGRFLTMDKHPGNILEPVTLHKYLYGGADPVNMIDPSGNFFSLGSVMISISISVTLATIAYNTFIKPVKEFYDDAKELLEEIPQLPLNKSVKRSDLGITIPNSLSDAQDPANWVNAGDGSLGKAYKIIEKMNSTAGKAVTQIHKWNATQFLRLLPMVNPGTTSQPDQVPGNYRDCGFNGYVQKTFALQLVTALKAAKFLGDIPNIIGLYLAYITFLEFGFETLEGWSVGGIPDQSNPCPVFN